MCILLVIAVLGWGSSLSAGRHPAALCARHSMNMTTGGLSGSARHKEQQQAIRTVLPVGTGSPVTGYVLEDGVSHRNGTETGPR